MTAEHWRDVPGYEGHYQVSDQGRVKSLRRPIVMKNGLPRCRPEQILKLIIKKNGNYRAVSLWLDGKQKQHLVHRLVLLTFVGPAPAGAEGCHNNGDPSNNTLANLRWGSNSSNKQDTVTHGRNVNVLKAHCPHGHPYDEANTIPVQPKTPSPDGRMNRGCRACNREKAKRRREATLAPDDYRHGTMNGYSNYGCACPACKEAGRANYRRLAN